jgi:hypothetical protein
MAGLVPAIPILNRDRRDKPGDDGDKAIPLDRKML